MIMTILAVLAIAGGLQPLIRRDLKRAVVRQRWRARGWHHVTWRIQVDTRAFQRALDRAAKELAALVEEFNKGQGGTR